MDGWVTALLLFTATVQTSFASESLEPARPIDPLRLKCTLRERKFFTEINFNENSRGELVGEVSNYVSLPSHGRQYLSGSVLFDITSGPDFVAGHTGDPRATVSQFKLYQLGLAPTGIWVFEHFEPAGPLQRARFNCIYSGE